MHKAESSDVSCLKAYLEESLAAGNEGVDRICPREDVTVLMYFFWCPEAASERWPYFAGALLATWRNCGSLPTVVVTNTRHRCVEDFASIYKNVQVQIESSLEPGNINTMSIDCNARLYTRFKTKYVLIVQDDGFPLRPGLDEFVDAGYDFIGSPYCRPKLIPDLLTSVTNYCPSNGGFSLRTNKICRMAAYYWEKSYSGRKFVVNDMSEDIFYTKTLPLREPLYWLRRRQAPSIISERFSYEGVFQLCANSLPFGFHTATAYRTLKDYFNIGI